MSIDVTPQAAPSLSERVAEEIRVLLTRRRIKQAHLARELGVSEQWLSIRLRGVQPIDLNDLQRIAGALGVQAIDLFPRIDTREQGAETGRHTTDRQSRPTEKTRPTGHPKRTSTHPATRRPARIPKVIKALMGRPEDSPSLGETATVVYG